MITHSEFRPGDYVVGSYTESGTPIKKGKVVGDEDDVNSLQRMIEQHASRTGSKLPNATPTKKAKITKSKKIIEPQEEYQPRLQEVEEKKEQPIIVKTVPKRPVQFHSNMGKIKMFVEDILECEIAFCLVFASEDDLIFIPNPGETLKMVTDNNNEYSVYYASSSFTWLDNSRKLMILFKSEDIQDE